MQEIQIRAAQKEDIAAVASLLVQVCNTHAEIRSDYFIAGKRKYSDSELSAILQNPNTPVFVAEDAGEVVGYVFCVLQRAGQNTKGDTLYIDDLCVDKKCRGKGIGTRLFEYACAYAKANGCFNVTLHVWQGNQTAEAFYDRFGMQTQKTCLEKIL